MRFSALLFVAGLSATLCSGAFAQDDPPADAMAVVEGKTIAADEYVNAITAAMRQKFYHGKIPEGQDVVVKREVARNMIERQLLLREAARREIKPDAAKVDKEIGGYEARYANSPGWAQVKEQALPALRAELEARSMLDQLEAAVRAQPKPTKEQVKVFYEKNGNLFTEPEKIRVSLILLNIDPSSTGAVWQAAQTEAEALVAKLRSGQADFAETAKLKSGDSSSQKGGDMGYLHHGMLPDPVQTKVDAMKVGEVSDPIRVLQGIAIIKLLDRVVPALRSFDDVAERAGDLLVRQTADKAWEDFKAVQRKNGKVVVNSRRFPELPNDLMVAQ